MSKDITYTNEQVRNIMRNEGPDYAVLDYMELEGIQDDELRELCLKMRGAQEEIRKFMENKFGKDWLSWNKKLSVEEVSKMDFEHILQYIYDDNKHNKNNTYLTASRYGKLFNISTFEDQMEMAKKIFNHKLSKEGKVKIEFGIDEFDMHGCMLEDEEIKDLFESNECVHPMTGKFINPESFKDIFSITIVVLSEYK